MRVQQASPWNDPGVISNHRRRQAVQKVYKGLAVACVLAVILPLGDLLYMFVYRGIEAISFVRVFHGLNSTTPGISNAILGTLLLVGLSSLIAIPLGILSGVYMAEFAKGSRFSEGVRFAADVLAGVPSIVLGYVGFLALVVYLGLGYSALAAALILSIIMFPYIFRTTEIAINKVPQGIKEGAVALGSTKTTMINRLVLRFAMPGILTGVLLSLGISLSETAPLLYTASFANYNPTGLVHSPLAYLTGVIWTFYQSPVEAQVQLAYVATFLLILIVLSLNVVARFGLRRFA
ncbi:MAG: phosphate ABC transporter permease PstA, partial [Nitrososphaerales archaeon]